MTEKTLEWDEEALARLENIPAFVRGMAKGKIEKAALAAGEAQVTVEFMDKIKQQEMGG